MISRYYFLADENVYPTIRESFLESLDTKYCDHETTPFQSIDFRSYEIEGCDVKICINHQLSIMINGANLKAVTKARKSLEESTQYSLKEKAK